MEAHVVLDDGSLQAREQLLDAERVRHLQAEGVAIGVVMVVHAVVVGGACIEIVLGRGSENG